MSGVVSARLVKIAPWVLPPAGGIRHNTAASPPANWPLANWQLSRMLWSVHVSEGVAHRTYMQASWGREESLSTHARRGLYF